MVLTAHGSNNDSKQHPVNHHGTATNHQAEEGEDSSSHSRKMGNEIASMAARKVTWKCWTVALHSLQSNGHDRLQHQHAAAITVRPTEEEGAGRVVMPGRHSSSNRGGGNGQLVVVSKMVAATMKVSRNKGRKVKLQLPKEETHRKWQEQAEREGRNRHYPEKKMMVISWSDMKKMMKQIEREQGLELAMQMSLGQWNICLGRSRDE